MITNFEENTKNCIVSYYEKKINLDNISIAYVIISYQKIKAAKHLLLLSNQNIIFIPLEASLRQIVIRYNELSEIQYSISQPNIIRMIISSNYKKNILLSNTIQDIISKFKVAYASYYAKQEKRINILQISALKEIEIDDDKDSLLLLKENIPINLSIRIMTIYQQGSFYLYSKYQIPYKSSLLLNKGLTFSFTINADLRVKNQINIPHLIEIESKEYLNELINKTIKGKEKEYYIYYEKLIIKSNHFHIEDNSRWKGIKLKAIVVRRNIKKQIILYGLLRDNIPPFYQKNELYVVYSINDFDTIDEDIIFNSLIYDKNAIDSELSSLCNSLTVDQLEDSILLSKELISNCLYDERTMKRLLNAYFNKGLLDTIPIGRISLQYVYLLIQKSLTTFNVLSEEKKNKKEVIIIKKNLSFIIKELESRFLFINKDKNKQIEFVEELIHLYDEFNKLIHEKTVHKILFCIINGGLFCNYFDISVIIQLIQLDSSFEFLNRIILDILLLNKPFKDGIITQYIASIKNLSNNEYYYPLLSKLMKTNILSLLLNIKAISQFYLFIMKNSKDLNDTFKLIHSLYINYYNFDKENSNSKSKRYKFFSFQFDIAIYLLEIIDPESLTISSNVVPIEFKIEIIKIISLISKHSVKLNLIDMLISHKVFSIVYSFLHSHDIKLVLASTELLVILSKIMESSHIVSLSQKKQSLRDSFECIKRIKKLMIWDIIINIVKHFSNLLYTENKSNSEEEGNSNKENPSLEEFYFRNVIYDIIDNNKSYLKFIIYDILLSKESKYKKSFEQSISVDRVILLMLTYMCTNHNNSFKNCLSDDILLLPKMQKAFICDEGYKSYFKYLINLLKTNEKKEIEYLLIIELCQVLFDFLYFFIEDYQLSFDEITSKIEYPDLYHLIDYITMQYKEPSSFLNLLKETHETNYTKLQYSFNKLIMYLHSNNI